ncbi:MAG: lysozyme inhibitor LprI family protein [Chitinispirillaceae bacterium]
MNKILILIIALSFLGYAEDIDSSLDSCLQADPSTFGMVECMIKATQRWDEKLNEVYKELMSVLTDSEKKKLRDSQRKWIEFKDNEISFINEAFAYDDRYRGTIVKLHRAEYVMNVTKSRAVVLMDYLSSYKDSLDD